MLLSTLPSGVSPSDPEPSPGFRCDTGSHAGEILVVRMSGELDLFCRSVADAALSDALRRAPVHLLVDLAGLRFCCVRGFELLDETAGTARTAGVGFTLSGMTAHQQRIATLDMTPPGPVRHPSVAAAIRSIRAGGTDDPAR